MVTQLSPLARRKALRTFRQRGVVVHVGALEHLFSAYETLPDLEFPDFLDSVFDLLGRADGATDGILTPQLAEFIAARLRRDSDRKDGLATATAEVIDIFAVPSWESASQASANAFFAGKRVTAPGKPIIDASAPEKANMFRTRYELIRGKTLRNEKFAPPASGLLSFAKPSSYFRLTGIESLPGSGTTERLVLGMLTQLEEGTWFLEDLNGVIRLDLSQANVTRGLHTECSFVIVQGRYIEIDGEEPYFQVTAMGTPPAEKREASLTAMSKNPNLFGGQIDASESASLLKMEKEAVDTIFLFLSDVALNNSKVIAGLRYLFQGYLEDEVLPKLIVLMGNFLSHPFGQHVSDMTVLAEKFTELGTMIRTDFEALANECMFVIIPGTNDPGPGNVLPRPPMPNIVMRGFINAIGEERVHLGTNPCRIRYLTQEIVLMRDDLMQKMVRHCAVKPDFGDSGPIPEHYVKSLVDQSHLCPLPNSSRPVLWRHAHAMWLFPLPHAIILADKVDSYVCRYEDTLGLNPGSFATDFSFQLYIPAERRAQQCSLDSENIGIDGVIPDAPAEESKDESVINPEDDDDAVAVIEDECLAHTGENRGDVQLSDVEMEDLDESGSESLPQPAQPREVHKRSNFDRDGKSPENAPRERTIDDDGVVAIDGQRIQSQAGESDSEAESDDDSLLVPVDGLEKRDIKALLRQSIEEEDSGPQEREELF